MTQALGLRWDTPVIEVVAVMVPFVAAHRRRGWLCSLLQATEPCCPHVIQAKTGNNQECSEGRPDEEGPEVVD